MQLHEALQVQRGDVVTFVGAGGKTSALLCLGRELMALGWRVLATTTTRLGLEELGAFPFSTRWRANLLRGNRELANLLDQHRFVFVYQEQRHDKAIGVPDESVSRLIDEMNADVLLVEADGSRRLPLKAPRHYEPVWPLDTTIAVTVAGLDALGQPFDQNVVYNPGPIIERYGFQEGAAIQPAWMAQIVRDETLGLKDVPVTARAVALLNKADLSGLVQARARRVAHLILRSSRVNSVLIGSVQNQENPILEVKRRVGAVILAAGKSNRMGTSKMLLPWGDRTVIEAVVQKLLPFPLSDIVVVTGYKAHEVNGLMEKYPVRTMFNRHYEDGEMLSSLKAGLRALGDEIDACLVVMGDQPHMSARVVRHVLLKAAEHSDSLVAPCYREQRGHPIVIPRRYWKELLRLRSGAPRDVINQNKVICVPVENDSILRDIDTPEQYAREKRLAGLE